MKSFFHRVNKHSGSLKLLLYFFLISLPCRCVLHCIHSITVHFFFPATDSCGKNTFPWWWWCRNQAVNSEEDRRKFGMNCNHREEIRSNNWYLVLSYCAFLSLWQGCLLISSFVTKVLCFHLLYTPQIREWVRKKKILWSWWICAF